MSGAPVETPEAALRERIISALNKALPNTVSMVELSDAATRILAALAAPSVAPRSEPDAYERCAKIVEDFFVVEKDYGEYLAKRIRAAAPPQEPAAPTENEIAHRALDQFGTPREDASGEDTLTLTERIQRLAHRTAPPAQSTEPDWGKFFALLQDFGQASWRAGSKKIPGTTEDMRVATQALVGFVRAAAPSQSQPAEAYRKPCDQCDGQGGTRVMGVWIVCPTCEGAGQPAAPQPEARGPRDAALAEEIIGDHFMAGCIVAGMGPLDALEKKRIYLEGRGAETRAEGESEERERIGQVLVGYLTHTLGYDAAIDRILALRAAPSPGGERET